MKNLLALGLVLLVSSIGLADTEGVTADGGIFFKNHEGALEKKEAKLFVPAKGQGKVVLTVGEETIEATKFVSKKAQGRVLFTVVFANANTPHLPKDHVAIMTGTYVRGTNLAVYHGDIFVQHAKAVKPGQLAWVGGFGFKAAVPAQE